MSTTPVWLARSLTMIAVGAVLALGVTVHTATFDIQTAGGCLFAVGVFDLVLNLALLAWVRSVRRAPRTTGLWTEQHAPYADYRHADDPDRTDVLHPRRRGSRRY